MTLAITRRGLLRAGGAAAAALLLDATLQRSARAGVDLDIGLVAPNSRWEPHTLNRVFHALSLHEKDNGKSIFPEFEGITVAIVALDSGHDSSKAVAHVGSLVAEHRVKWIVSGDVLSHVTKATELQSKSLEVACIIACDRMKLEKSNPHPYVFQLLPDYSAWFRGLFEKIAMLNTPPGPVVILSEANAEAFFRGNAGEVFDGQAKVGRPVIFDNQLLADADLRRSVLAQTGNRKPTAIVLMTTDPQVASHASNAFGDVPKFVDATIEDPVDMAQRFADVKGDSYLVAMTSRDSPVSALQQQFTDAFWKDHNYEADPISFYGGVAAQVIAHTLKGGDIRELSIAAENSVGGFAVKFDDQGRNEAAIVSLFKITGGEATRVS